ncbi:MAG TPA: hypothetical protein VMT52_06170 [Planctomycetota bacterium]|nr:hypothetical protein [Planctomycetota bacterium]
MSAAKHLLSVSLIVLGSLVSPAAGAPSPLAAEKESGKGKETPRKGESPQKDTETKAAPGREEAAAGKREKLETWGAIRGVKGTDFFTLAYRKLEGKKLTVRSAFIKLSAEAEFHADRAIAITELKEGETVWVLGRPIEREIPSRQGGGSDTDHQIQNVSAIAAGESIRVNEKYRDPRDDKVRWCQATVTKAGPSISVKYGESVFKVVMAKAHSYLRREKVERPAALKSGVHVAVALEPIEERPETRAAADLKKESFQATRVVLLDRRLMGTLYPALLE